MGSRSAIARPSLGQVTGVSAAVTRVHTSVIMIMTMMTIMMQTTPCPKKIWLMLTCKLKLNCRDNATCHSYDVIELVSKQITRGHVVFIPLSIDAKTTKIDQESKTYSRKATGLFFSDTMYRVGQKVITSRTFDVITFLAHPAYKFDVVMTSYTTMPSCRPFRLFYYHHHKLRFPVYNLC